YQHLCLPSHLFSFMLPPPPTSTLFPYTTLFRSLDMDERICHELLLRGDGACGPPSGQSTGILMQRRRRFRPAGAVHLRERERLRSEEHTSELQSPYDLVCRLLLEKKKKKNRHHY